MKFRARSVMLSLFFAQLAYVVLSESEPQPNCPNLLVENNTSDPFVLQKLEREVTIGMWKSPQMSQPSELAAQLRDILLEMSESDSFYFTDIAFQITGWSTAFLAEVNTFYPSFCPFAAVINKTVEWQSSGNIERYIEALKLTSDMTSYATDSYLHALLAEMECKNNTDPPVVSKNCWQNGLVSCQDEIWEIYGRLMPWPLRNIGYHLANSPLFSDKAYATIISYVLTPSQYFIYTNQPYPFLIEGSMHFIAAANVSKCCCDQFKSRMVVMNDVLNQTAHENANKKIDELLHECKR